MRQSKSERATELAVGFRVWGVGCDMAMGWQIWDGYGKIPKNINVFLTQSSDIVGEGEGGVLQPFPDRVAQSIDVISMTVSTNWNSTHGFMIITR